MALYALAPDLPLYRVLPPPFKQWWTSKLDKIKAEKEAEASLSAVEKQRRSDKIIADVVRRVLLHAAAADDEAADAAEEQELEKREKVVPTTKKDEEPQESWEDLLESDDDDAWDADKEPTSPIVEEVVEDIDELRYRGDELRTWWLDRKSSPG